MGCLAILTLAPALFAQGNPPSPRPKPSEPSPTTIPRADLPAAAVIKPGTASDFEETNLDQSGSAHRNWLAVPGLSPAYNRSFLIERL